MHTVHTFYWASEGGPQASIAWFLRWLGSHQLVGFAVYRIAAGLALLAALAARIVSA